MSDLAPESNSTPLLQPRLPIYLVDTNESLYIFLSALKANNSPIAIDAERASGFRYGQKAYLIQFAIEAKAIYLLDPTIDYDADLLTQVKEYVNSADWIIHAASQDLTCLGEYGLNPSGILDTELAGRILGLPKVSLGTLTEKYLGLVLAKEHSAVDWSTRPLPDSWLNYAALDVDVLFELWESVRADLITKNKLEIALAEFKHLTIPQPKVAKTDRWRGVTGVHEIKDQRQLTIVKAIWSAREELAKTKDIAPGRLIPDAAIIAAVKAAPKSRSELAELRTFSGRASRTYLDTWWDAYHHGLTTYDLVELRPKSNGIPNHRSWPTKFPQANVRLQWARKLISELSSEKELPVENLLSPEVLRGICFEPPEITNIAITQYLLSKGVRAWQAELTAPLLAEALGKTELPEPPITASVPDEQ